PDFARYRAATPEQQIAYERLTRRLTDPASWLPASAWEDRETRAYVPSRHVVCLWPGEVEAQLPGPVKDLLLTKGTRVADDDGSGCAYQVTPEVYREIIRALDDAELESSSLAPMGPEYTIFQRLVPYAQGGDVVGETGIINFPTMLPDGEVPCKSCG
ncbi:MAG TPA: hypothetical protein VJZ72_01125, partial [Candidatus Limnocylindrales bacterium]|nr:hypothetical protein [Candidatus Limnocylindrales bacterium]